MAFIVADRVREVSASIGTGVFNLSGSPIGYQTFSASVGNGNTTYYVISNPGVNEWEVGIGTVGAGTLTRTTILASSNGGTAVNFTAGSKDVFVTYPAEAAVFADNTVTLTNKTISGASNTLSNIGNSSLTNSSLIIGSTNIALGATSTSLAGLTSVAATTFTGSLTGDVTGNVSGNAGTVTNGVYTTGDQTIGGTKTFSNNPILNAGTANGVAYLNGSKVLTTGSALTFDGTLLTVGNAKVETGSGYAGLNTVGAIPFNFYINNAEQMRLTSTGLGIGTSSPYALLNPNAASRNTTAAWLTAPLYNAGAAEHSDYVELKLGNSFIGLNTIGQAAIRTYANVWASSGSNLTFHTSDSSGTLLERLRLDSSGNLGLGVTPSAWNSVYRAAQVGSGASISGRTDDSTWIEIDANCYRNTSGSWTALYSGTSSRYQQEAGAHKWYTAGITTAGNAISFTQAMTLDASGNLGIGTSSPSNRLSLVTASTGNVTAINFTDNATDTGYLGLRTGGGVGMWAGGFLAFGSGSGTFTERMRIDSSGNLLVGKATTATNVAGLMLSLAGSNRGNIAFYNQAGFGANACSFYYDGSACGQIVTDSNTTAYQTSSDYRLKENIQPMQNALGVVAQLNPVTYNWKVDGSNGQGFIAHELQAVVPDCVTGEKDAVDKYGKPVYQGIDTSFLVGILTKAIQEQQEQINQLTARVAQLEGN